ncbi:DUF4270 domain-containing protein [Flavobacterium lacus]|uniref:Uncharacterized protein DUF4270 n=1 Tax=Flavobacterium lacus TaxID=1353778 RepID=A0A328WW14_9FLAO|nr:DUF4270 domain-containing protein [Flavobacterium lacus]RAR48034.1 uncharacterized protein DUF4270 [Flavobacterium lacus]
MISKKLTQYTSIAALALLLFSCDKDFNTIGGSVIGDDHFQFGIKDIDATVVAYNQDLGAAQTNNLVINPLGIYNNTAFGKTTAHFVTQVSLPGTTAQTFNPNPVIEEVILYIPYFSRKGTTDSEGVATYELDSVYGASKLKLSVFENGYFLRDFDPNTQFTEAQRYYSDQMSDFENNKRGAASDGTSIPNGERLNNSTNVAENDQFFFNPAEISVTTGEGDDETTTKSAPGIYLTLNKDFFQKKIIGGYNQNKLVTNNVFSEYFRGLYFKVEASEVEPNGNSLAMINFTGGKITIKYEQDDDNLPETDGREKKTLELSLTGNTVCLTNQERSTNYSNALAAADAVQGDEKLYINGGAGSMAVINLFNRDEDGESAELEQYRANGWLINEANLTFRIDRDAMGNNVEPNRIYLYDLDNKIPLIDYTNDFTTNSTKPKFGKSIHGGIIRLEDGKGVSYKIRITNHIANLLKNPDFKNVRLGLVVTEAIGNVGNYKLKNQTTTGIKEVPIASIMNPLGTVLYGSKSSVSLEQRLKLEIYYTKPD